MNVLSGSQTEGTMRRWLDQLEGHWQRTYPLLDRHEIGHLVSAFRYEVTKLANARRAETKTMGEAIIPAGNMEEFYNEIARVDVELCKLHSDAKRGFDRRTHYQSN